MSYDILLNSKYLRTQIRQLMPVTVILTPYFIKEAKPLIKNYRSLKADLQVFTESLKENPRQGDMLMLAPDIYKVRLAVKSKGGGKSKGVRIITHVEIVAVLERENEKDTDVKVRLLTIYDKSDYDTVDVPVIKSILEDILEEDQDTDNE
jgi:mRNA-degrading endonuclease RelE of RelBE toxin-antitoxin system